MKSQLADPISSLASTIAGTLDAEGKAAEVTALDNRDMHEALVTIQRRSEGLLSFVDSYRRLTRIPTPSFAPVSVTRF